MREEGKVIRKWDNKEW